MEKERTTYPLKDYYIGYPLQHKLRAVSTNEFRPPRKGEWYISGAIPEAYRAPNDLSTPYMIAHIVMVEKTIVETIKEIK